jgi:hypothetical protein
MPLRSGRRSAVLSDEQLEEKFLASDSEECLVYLDSESDNEVHNHAFMMLL